MSQQPNLALRLNTAAHGLRRGVLGATDHRVMLTLQGCSHNKCLGCTSPHTWDANGGRLLPVGGLVRWMQSLPRVEGLTITGGEPTDQAETLIALLRQFRTTFPNAEVVIYSALLWPRLQQQHAALVAQCDVVVAGPFVASLPATPLAGSDNQTVHLLTPLAERLYADWKAWPVHRVQIGIARAPSEVLMVGIPSRALNTTHNPHPSL